MHKNIISFNKNKYQIKKERYFSREFKDKI
jgi:hypothetical protein